MNENWRIDIFLAFLCESFQIKDLLDFLLDE